MVVRRTSLLLTLLLCLALPSWAASRAVPELALKDLAGHNQKLSALRGQIVVLSFWATWCTPCRQELPRLSGLGESYAGKPVKFVAVSIDEGKKRDGITAFLTRENVHLDVWAGATTDAMQRFGLTDIVPSTIIIDEGGQPITRITGEAQEDDIRSRVDWLLGGRTGPTPDPVLKRM